MSTESTTNPLHELHLSAEAEMQSYGDTPIVSTFGEPQAEYAAIHKSAALLDLPQRGFIELTGPDRLTFLNSLLSNATWDRETKSLLAAGRCVFAFLLSAKTGRIICDVQVIELGERTLLELDARLLPAVLEQLQRYHFGEKLTIASKTGALHEIALLGPGALDVLRDASDDSSIADRIIDNHAATTRMLGQEIIVARDDALIGQVGLKLIVPYAQARSIWMNFISRFSSAEAIGKRPLRPIGWAVFNAARIEAATPLFGIDFDANTLPAETGRLLERHVSFNKGCYPGQEVVARMHARGQVAKQIAAFQMAGNELPIAGVQMFDDAHNQIGVVTSSTISPILSGRAIGLAMVKKPHFTVGSKVRIPAEGELREATIVEPPFVAAKKESV